MHTYTIGDIVTWEASKYKRKVQHTGVVVYVVQDGITQRQALEGYAARTNRTLSQLRDEELVKMKENGTARSRESYFVLEDSPSAIGKPKLYHPVTIGLKPADDAIQPQP